VLSFAAETVCASQQRLPVPADDEPATAAFPDNDGVTGAASALHVLTSFVTLCNRDGGKALPAVLRSISGSATVGTVADAILSLTAPTTASSLQQTIASGTNEDVTSNTSTKKATACWWC
jgi:hypothetical protein